MADLLRKASGSTRPVPTTLSTPKSNGSATAELTVATGWNTTTDLDVIIYRRQLNTTTGLYEKVEGTQTEWVADSLTGTTLSGMTLRAGTEPASGYAADGNTVVMCGPTSAYADDLYAWGNSFATPQGALRASAVQTALGISGGAGDGWSILNAGTAPTVSTGYNKGNKEFDLTFSGVDLTSVLSPGMRLKLNRGTTPPTQCADLESSSSQYASKTTPAGITQTDDITIEAWVKLESYTGAYQAVLTRMGANQGFAMQISTTGQIVIVGFNASYANNRTVTSYQSIPLNTWVHIAGTLDMSGWTSSTNKIFINGVDVPASLTSAGTNPTAFVQEGSLEVGAQNGATNPFDGKIADARLWSAIRTATQIRDNMNQQLVGNETNLVAYYKLNGNLNDSTSNANNLTGSGGAVATDTDNPMKSTEYAIIHKVAFSTNTTVTVFTGTDYNIPNMTFSNPYYSTQDTPFGFPRSKGKWRVLTTSMAQLSATISANVWTNLGIQLSIPTGDWIPGYNLKMQVNPNSASAASCGTTLSTANNSELSRAYTVQGESSSSNTTHAWPAGKDVPMQSLTAQTVYYLNTTANVNSTVYQRGDNVSVDVYAQSAYV